MTEIKIVRTTINNRPRNVALLSLMLCLTAVTACTVKQATAPAITPNPTGNYLVGNFAWFYLLTNDVPAAAVDRKSEP